MTNAQGFPYDGRWDRLGAPWFLRMLARMEDTWLPSGYVPLEIGPCPSFQLWLIGSVRWPLVPSFDFN